MLFLDPKWYTVSYAIENSNIFEYWKQFPWAYNIYQVFSVDLFIDKNLHCVLSAKNAASSMLCSVMDGDRTIAGFVFSVTSKHGKINELLKQLCNQFHIYFQNATYKSYEKNITENGKCFLLEVFPIYQFDSFYTIRHEHFKKQPNTTIILLYFSFFFFILIYTLILTFATLFMFYFVHFYLFYWNY